MKGIIPAPTRTSLHVVRGMIYNSGDDPVTGIGTATVILRPDGTAEIHYQLQITIAGTGSRCFVYGLNRDMLRNLDPSIPLITPTTGGTVLYYTSDGKLDLGSMQYAGIHQGQSVFWVPARIYTETGGIGAWPATKMLSGMRLDGVCYGTYT